MAHSRASRPDYAHFETQPTRWRDNDVYGHMNNAVFYEYVDTIVSGWLVRTGALEVPHGPVIALAVETSCRFHASLGFPDAVEAGLRLGRLGRSSIAYEVGLFRAGEPLAAAEARFVHVCVERDSRRPVPVPERLRAALNSLRVPD
jgi:acyl-CoA thioester hydrolase